MFTVKATYRSETRKFSFQESTFPSYAQLYDQLYRVFPISNSYYISRLLFSSNPSSPSSRILIGSEAHNAEEYEAHIEPFKNREWPGALLRFSVYDETPHKMPNVKEKDEEPVGAEDTASEFKDAAPQADTGPSASQARPRVYQGGNSALRWSVQMNPEQVHINGKGEFTLLGRAGQPRERSWHWASNGAGSASPNMGNRPASPSAAPQSYPDPQPHPHKRPHRHSYHHHFHGDHLNRSPPLGPPLASAPPPPPPPPPLPQRHLPHPPHHPHHHHHHHPYMSFPFHHLPPPPPPPPMFNPWSMRPPPPPPPPPMPRFYSYPPPPGPPPEVHVQPPTPEPITTARGPGGNVGVPTDATSTMLGVPNPFGPPPVRAPRPDSTESTTKEAEDSENSGATAGGTSANKEAPPTTTLYEAFSDVFKAGSPVNHSPIQPGLSKASEPIRANVRGVLRRPESLDSVRIRSLFRNLNSHQEESPSHIELETLQKDRPFHDWNGVRIPRDPLEGPSSSTMPAVASYTVPTPKPKGDESETCCDIAKGKKEVQSLVDRFAEELNGVLGRTFGEQEGFKAITFESLFDEEGKGKGKEVPTDGLLEVNAVEHQNAIEHIDAADQDGETSPDSPVVHLDVICDMCDQVIVGTRYSCMSCDNYDLCGSCILTFRMLASELSDSNADIDGSQLMHPGSHEFFAIYQAEHANARKWIRRDDGVWRVRSPSPILDRGVAGSTTVYDGLGEAEPISRAAGVRELEAIRAAQEVLEDPFADPVSELATSVRAVPEQEVVEDRQDTPVQDEQSDSRAQVVHRATCDLCDSTIVGDRYKCVFCPDFDACSACWAIVPEQHPHHGFVRITNPKDFIRPRGIPLDISPLAALSWGIERHAARCDACSNQIIGIRYKCMHPACPDFDLCAACEAHPIPVHPISHPLLKVKTTDTVIPAVPRYGHPQPVPVVPLTNAFAQTSEEQEEDLPGADKESASDECVSVTSEPQVTSAHIQRSPRAVLTAFDPSRRVPMSACAVLTALDSSQRVPIAARPEPAESVGLHIEEAEEIIPTSRSRSASIGPVSETEHERLLPTQASLFYPFTPESAWPPRIPTPERVAPTSPGYVDDMLRRLETRERERMEHARALWVPQCELFYPAQSPTTSPSGSPSPLSNLDMDPTPGALEHPSLNATNLSELASNPQADLERATSPEPLIRLEDFLNEDAGVNEAHNLNATSSTSTSTRASNSPAPPQVLPSAEREQGSSPLPRVQPTDFNELFDIASHFRHLLDLPPVGTPPAQPFRSGLSQLFSPSAHSNGSSTVPSVPTELASSDGSKQEQQEQEQESPIDREALLSEPDHPAQPSAVSPRRSLSDLLDGAQKLAHLLKDTVPRGSSRVQTLSELLNGPAPTSSATTGSRPTSFITDDSATVVPEFSFSDAPLRASFVADNNILDGQMFPPGAEFVKSWRMRNDGVGAWPAETELVFVAGDRMALEKTERFKVGSVGPGEEVDVWTGEMKAPDVPGKYIGYWRLSDGKGVRFGHSIWIDITVVEPSLLPTKEDSEGSLASSAIIMPHSASERERSSTIASTQLAAQDEATTAPLSPTFSDNSSVSLIDIPSSDEEEDEDFVDSRSHFGSTPISRERRSPEQEYVVLDDSSDDE